MTDLARQLFEQAFQHIEKARAAKPELFEQNADIQSLYGSCLFNKARMVTHEGNEQESKKLLDKAIEILTKAEDMQGEPGDAKTLETVREPSDLWRHVLLDRALLLIIFVFYLSW